MSDVDRELTEVRQRLLREARKLVLLFGDKPELYDLKAAVEEHDRIVRERIASGSKLAPLGERADRPNG